MGGPTPSRLTEFYLWVSLGGVLGGLFNSLVAPLIFSELLEYPIVLIASCFLLPAAVGDRGRVHLIDVVAALGVAGLTLTLYYLPEYTLIDKWLPLVISLPLPSTVRPFYRWASFKRYTVWNYASIGVPLLSAIGGSTVRFGSGCAWRPSGWC